MQEATLEEDYTTPGGSDGTITKDNAADYLNEQIDKSLAINAERREMLTPERQAELDEEQNKISNNITTLLNNFPETSEQALADREEKAQANVEIDLPTSPITFESDSDSGDSDTTSSVNEADVEAGLATESIAGEISNAANQAANPQDSSQGSSSSGGGGKIVCTMMNKTYGFGSFRNKIWLRQSKNLAPEYQKGYHILFLPLVKISKTNKIVRKILEHIAVHRTIDIRQESRGKTHMLGRIYRKILEPICYWVGKNAKR